MKPPGSPPGYAGAAVHGVVLAAAYLVLARELTLWTGLVFGALGCVLGTGLAAAATRARLRLGASAGLAGVAFAVGALLAHALDGWPSVGRLLGMELAAESAEAARALAATAAGAFFLRRLVYAWRGFLVIEGALLVWAVATPVAAHRDGMIARPLELADALWRRGIDPVVGFLALGAGAAVLVAASFVRGRATRGVIQILVAALIALGLVLPLNEAGNALGLRDPPGKSGGGDGELTEPGEERPGSASDQLGQRSGQAASPGNPNQERRPVAVAVFHRDVKPAGGVFYFRDAAFSRFNGSRLVESTRPGVDPDLVWRFPRRKMEVPAPPEQDGLRTRVALDISLLTEHGRAFTLSDPVEVHPRPNPAPARFTRAYGMVSSVLTAELTRLFGREAGDTSWDTETWHHYTEVPGDARYLELAERIDDELQGPFREDPFARALAVKAFLEKTTIYSFAVDYEGPDPTAAFLFVEGDRRGYCTHIAHSAALLLRALGVPTRVSGGYAAEASRLRGGSSLLLFGGDAHAWVEVRLEGVGWVPIEITPERTEVEPPPFQERDLQQLLGEMARAEGLETDTPPDAVDLGALFEQLARAGPWVAVGLLGLAYLVRLLRWLRPRVQPESVGPSYRAALDRLVAAGWVRRPGESRERFALRVQAVAPSMVPLTRLLSAKVLGEASIGRAPGGRTAGALAAAVGRELARTLPWWRTALSWLHPIPFFWSR